MRSKDPDPKTWSPPFTKQALSTEIIQCTGKNIADGVESLIGAFFMSTNLYKTLRFISDIQLVPLQQARLLEIFPDEELLLDLKLDLDSYGFQIEDSVSTVYKKYFNIQKSQDEQRISDLFCFDRSVNRFGTTLSNLKQNVDFKSLDTSDLV